MSQIQETELKLDLGKNKTEALRHQRSNPEATLASLLRLYPARAREPLPESYYSQALKHFLISPMKLKKGTGVSLKPEGAPGGQLRDVLDAAHAADVVGANEPEAYPVRLSDGEALKIAYETGNRNAEMVFLSNLGGARVGKGEYRVAEYELRRVIRWAEIAGQGGWLSDTYRFLAEACLGQHKVKETLAAAQRALVLGQEVGAPALIGGAWRILGMAVTHAAKPVTIADKAHDAEACFAESMRIFTEMGAEGERARTQ